jgi:hypothetical protein
MKENGNEEEVKAAKEPKADLPQADKKIMSRFARSENIFPFRQKRRNMCAGLFAVDRGKIRVFRGSPGHGFVPLAATTAPSHVDRTSFPSRPRKTETCDSVARDRDH